MDSVGETNHSTTAHVEGSPLHVCENQNNGEGQEIRLGCVRADLSMASGPPLVRSQKHIYGLLITQSLVSISLCDKETLEARWYD